MHVIHSLINNHGGNNNNDEYDDKKEVECERGKERFRARRQIKPSYRVDKFHSIGKLLAKKIFCERRFVAKKYFVHKNFYQKIFCVLKYLP